MIHEDHLRELLTTMGDRFTDEEVDELFREAPIDKKGNFNYAEFTRILKHGAKDKDDMWSRRETLNLATECILHTKLNVSLKGEQKTNKWCIIVK